MEQWESSFSDELAKRWDEYVDCGRRLKTEAAFLRRTLAPYKQGTIVDAAMGLGCEAIYLIQHGFKVIGNEIDERLRASAKDLARSRKVALQTTAVDWRSFSEHFGESSLDAVMILGNSLCLLASSEERRNACAQVFKSLRPGGVFIVDQRNFDSIFEKRREILAGSFEYSSRFMYCQTGIEGKPTVITPSRVRISCFDKLSRNLLGYFDVYPFRGRELQELVESVGFEGVETHYDFSPESEKRWDFATVVCYKR